MVFESVVSCTSSLSVFHRFSFSNFYHQPKLDTSSCNCLAAAFLGAGVPDLAGLGIITLIVFLLALGVTAISLGLAFALPGHIELIAVIFVSNLPLLFASTALAPLSFMPGWLQVVAALNPLSYAIEPIRYLYVHQDWGLNSVVMHAFWGDVTFGSALLVLFGFAIVALLSIQPRLRQTLA